MRVLSVVREIEAAQRLGPRLVIQVATEYHGVGRVVLGQPAAHPLRLLLSLFPVVLTADEMDRTDHQTFRIRPQTQHLALRVPHGVLQLI
ncbi:hypothetical protein D7X96_03420 [Corallococcus interemptor]|uniref:Uncharacterized protein n=1 Tax=Corallococcus interemptor TaxID=2316720 RepID=A0A3A8QWQ3_9BACT|nr:hypothetical protein D7X96_03420 [Corallococcus interemptor]